MADEVARNMIAEHPGAYGEIGDVTGMSTRLDDLQQQHRATLEARGRRLVGEVVGRNGVAAGGGKGRSAREERAEQRRRRCEAQEAEEKEELRVRQRRTGADRGGTSSGGAAGEAMGREERGGVSEGRIGNEGKGEERKGGKL